MERIERATVSHSDPIPSISQPTIIFVINRSLTNVSASDDEVYRATRCCWVIGHEARDRAVYALGVAHGIVRGAYRIDNWRATEGGRWQFDGQPAHELNVIGTSTERIKAAPGAANPVRLFLNGIP